MLPTLGLFNLLHSGVAIGQIVKGRASSGLRRSQARRACQNIFSFAKGVAKNAYILWLVIRVSTRCCARNADGVGGDSKVTPPFGVTPDVPQA